MAGGKDEAVAVRPDGVRRVEVQPLLPEAVDDGRHAHGGTRMTRLRLLDGVDRQRAYGVDAETVEVVFDKRLARGGD